jgi:multiple sugar transport system permease protein
VSAQTDTAALAPEVRWRLPFNPWHLILFPTAFAFALPLMWLLLSSFMSNTQINQFPPTIIPDSLHLDGWNTVLGDSDFPRWFVNSMIVALVTVVSNVVFCSLAGYAFARMKFRGSTILFLLILLTLIIPFELTMIPTFIVMDALGLVDSASSSSTCRRRSRRRRGSTAAPGSACSSTWRCRLPSPRSRRSPR